MKKKHFITTAIACLLLTGCSANRYTAPKVNYADMFQPKASSGEAVRENKVNAKAAASIEESAVFSDDVSDDTEIESEVSTENKSSNGGLTVVKSRTARSAPGGNDQSAGDTTNNNTQDNNAVSGTQNSDAGQSTDNTASDRDNDTSVSVIDNRDPVSIVYTDAQSVAELSLGDICYFPYKTGDENLANDEETEADAPEEGEDESPKVEKTPKNKKNDYGYRVVFKTETDTYLLGIFPYDQCKWKDVNDVCQQIEGLIEADCQMVGIPSFDDLRYFTDRGIYLPGKYEMWTRTLATPEGEMVYFRNKNGSFYSTKRKALSCGVCAIIRVSAPQNDPELLSSSLADYEEEKERLEAEEEQYKQAFSEEDDE